MRILAVVQAFFAAALLLMGLVTLFSIGITGLIMLVTAGVFAATAGAVSTGYGFLKHGLEPPSLRT